jgi:hypothetical protein
LLCGRCNERFNSPDELQSHQKNEVVCEPSFETPDVTEGFNDDQERKLRKRKRSGLNEAGKWGEVYRILFPHDTGEIPSPCKILSRCNTSIAYAETVSTSDLTEDAKLRQALKSEVSRFVRDSYSELSRRVRQNLELHMFVESPRLKEATQSGLLDLILGQAHRDMQELIEEFLSRTSNPQSRTVTPLGELQGAMEDGSVAPLLDMAGIGLLDELNLPADGFGPLESDGVMYWPSGRLSDTTLPSSSTGEATGWQVGEPQFGALAQMGSWTGEFGV